MTTKLIIMEIDTNDIDARWIADAYGIKPGDTSAYRVVLSDGGGHSLEEGHDDATGAISWRPCAQGHGFVIDLLGICIRRTQGSSPVSS